MDRVTEEVGYRDTMHLKNPFFFRVSCITTQWNEHIEYRFQRAMVCNGSQLRSEAYGLSLFFVPVKGTLCITFAEMAPQTKR